MFSVSAQSLHKMNERYLSGLNVQQYATDSAARLTH